jgi:glycopeptide antibiotics resistance protein
VTRALFITAIVAVIVNVTMWPWSTFVGHSHWRLVEWVPFSHGVRPLDIIANLVLFVPFGWALAVGRARRAMPLIVLAGALLSMSIELLQVYCHGHFPTSTDVLTNTCGTWLGVLLARTTVRT